MVENVQESLPGGGSFSDPDPGYGGSSGGYDQGTIQVGKKILLYGIDSTGSTGINISIGSKIIFFLKHLFCSNFTKTFFKQLLTRYVCTNARWKYNNSDWIVKIDISMSGSFISGMIS